MVVTRVHTVHAWTTLLVHDEMRPLTHALRSASQSAELNNHLVNLVKRAQYDEAYRLRNHLFENNVHINHHLVYEKAALAGVELSEETDKGLEKFIIWFSLVPDRNELPTSLTTQRQYIYSDTRFSLLRCGIPNAYLKYIMVFGNIMAAKGYILVSFLEVARLVGKFGRKELVADYFKELEEATAYYYWEQEPAEGGCVLAWFWEVVIKLYVEKGWLDLAFEAVVEKGPQFGLSVELYRVLLKKLEDCGDGERASVIRILRAQQTKKLQL
ncbi:hypothetical protein BYT27DRAFT_7207177 [Phlegmacium glaucopus]|nr:hypothetical protein BYT27DRAFT_7207177 [Phlegmacium glaucopus]